MSYGYDYKKYPNMLVYEINSNSNVSAGAFYKYGENAESSANISERDYYARDFKLIYGNRTSSNDTYAEIKELVEWVSLAEYDLFRETISEHFNKEYLFRYLLTVLMIGGVDSLGKNCKINTYDGRVWYPTFYDLDTSLGVDNSGYLTVPADAEIEEGMFNTSNSNLWRKVMDYFARELKEEWSNMRQKNFTLDKLMEYVHGEQISKIPAKMYNMDAQTKYLDFGSLYTYCCHGSKEHLVRRWLRERIAYVDSMLEYFTSQEDQIILRMNRTGLVEFNVTSYIPLYFSVKWSNAQGGVQTIKVERNKSYKFSFNSTTATDQEVIVYHAKNVKRLDNLTNLNVSSCLLANAYKLTEVEIHSPLLYNINVSENKFLRRLDLSGCKALGTVVAVGTTLDLSKCSYLKYVNTHDTALTAINFNSKGGSLREIYYPKTVQSITMIKQPLLETLGLPYGIAGEDIPTALYNVEIRDCTAIKKLNTSSNVNISKSMASMVYCSNLTLRNSLALTSLSFEGFKRLRNVKMENMLGLESVGFNDLLPTGQEPTLAYIGLSNCPKIVGITLNCSNNDYEVAFANNATLDFGKLATLKRISSNCVIKGLKTIIVPKQLDTLDFKLNYGEGVSDIANIWVGDVCNVDDNGTTITVSHMIPNYEGIDFKGMTIKSIDMMGFGKIKDGINFNISPVNVNPNLNTARDGSVNKPWFRPQGILDLSGYTLDFKGMFKGLDLDRMSIVLPDRVLEDSDISNLFEGTTFSDTTFVNETIAKFSKASKLDYIFKNSDITSGTKIVFPKSRFSLKGGFMGSKLTSDVSLPLNVIDVTDCFRDCIAMKNATSNWKKSFTYAIAHETCYYNCVNIEKIDGSVGHLREIPYNWGGFGFTSDVTGEYVVEIPNNDFTVNVGDILMDGTIEWGDGSYTHGTSTHIYKQVGIYTIRGKALINSVGQPPHQSVAQTLLNVNKLPANIDSFENMFANCGMLRIVNLSQTDTSRVNNTSSMFKNCASIVTPPTMDLSSVTQMKEMYSGCSNILNIRFKNLLGAITDCSNIVSGCNKLTTLTFNGRITKENARKIIDEFNRFMSENSVNLVDMSSKVGRNSASIDSINTYQVEQDGEILTNMVASAEIFELVLTLIGMSSVSLLDNINIKNTKGVDGMVAIYSNLVLKEVRKIDDVPELIRKDVRDYLNKC